MSEVKSLKKDKYRFASNAYIELDENGNPVSERFKDMTGNGKRDDVIDNDGNFFNDYDKIRQKIKMREKKEEEKEEEKDDGSLISLLKRLDDDFKEDIRLNEQLKKDNPNYAREIEEQIKRNEKEREEMEAIHGRGIRGTIMTAIED